MLKKKLCAMFGLSLLSASLVGASAYAEMESPKHGGELQVMSIWAQIAPMTFDNYDWVWKQSHDAGGIYESLFAADMSKAVSRGGPFKGVSSFFLPPELMRGELAESWEWTDPSHLVIKLRKGIMFPEKPGIMAARELTAEDVVFNYNRVSSSPKLPKNYYGFVKSATALDKHTVVFEVNSYSAEWALRLGYGYSTGVIPKEVVDAGPADWKNMNGTGPFRLTEYIDGTKQTYEKNEQYWDTEAVNGQNLHLPYVDKVVYNIVKDEATRVTALRTGKVDLMELVRWQDAEVLMKSVPELKWNKWVYPGNIMIAMRADQKPFDDIRVRRALNMAVNKQEIIQSYYNGNAELLAFPQYAEFGAYNQPLNEQPESVQELFSYNPEKAKALLTEAGYPNGFTWKVQVYSGDPNHMDLIQLVAAYLEQVGVTVQVVPMEYGAFLSAMSGRTHEAGYMLQQQGGTPTTGVEKFTTTSIWNVGQLNLPGYDERVKAVFAEADVAKQTAEIRKLTTDVLDAAPYITLPTPYNYTAWWPWVKGYAGEQRAGFQRPWPVYARIWIDQDLKKKMGY